MKTDEDFIRAAIEEAKLAKAAGEWPFGAVIVRNGEIIARAACTETGTKNVLGHAELQAINGACLAVASNNLSDCAIYGIRHKRTMLDVRLGNFASKDTKNHFCTLA